MCGIIGVIDKQRDLMDGSAIRDALSIMDERGSGEGAGYAGAPFESGEKYEE